jgi:two-component system nitrogen regulation response regulator GlnG
MQKKVLIADDDASIRLVVSQALTRAGYQVRATGAASTLLKWAADGEGDLIVTDVMMPDANVFDVLPQIRKHRPNLPIIVMSAQNTVVTAVTAAERGAFEYLPKPFDLDDLIATAERALAPAPAVQQARADAKAARDERLPLIGRSTAMQDVYRTLARLVPTELTVLITGDSGTGKELTARALHDFGRRRDGKFVVVHLAATPRERVETELFGRDGMVGKLVEADGGTLFLDEVGDLPLDAQTRLLRVIDGSERPINPRTERPVDARLVAATNRDLTSLIAQGLFRQDLFFRLNVAPLRLPPLRDRKEDIPDLARAFLLRAHREGLSAKTVDDGALARLKAHSWPGNVRELENLMRRIAALYAEPVITARIVERELEPPAPAAEGEASLDRLVELAVAADLASGHDELYDRMIATVERPLIRTVLAATRGNQVKAAERLGLNRNTLRKKILALGLSARDDDDLLAS